MTRGSDRGSTAPAEKSGNGFRSTCWDNSDNGGSRDRGNRFDKGGQREIPTTGRVLTIASVFASVTPTRTPVNDPGPSPTPIPVTLLSECPVSLRIKAIMSLRRSDRRRSCGNHRRRLPSRSQTGRPNKYPRKYQAQESTYRFYPVLQIFQNTFPALAVCGKGEAAPSPLQTRLCRVGHQEE